MTFTITLAPSITVTLDSATARNVVQQLASQGLMPANQVGAAHREPALPDEHPYWSSHSGGVGHTKLPEWSASSLPEAEAFYARVSANARTLLDLFMDNPGFVLTSEQIRKVNPSVFPSDNAIAGSLNGLRKPMEASGKRYPFYWWKGTPTRYAMKASVAELFVQARARMGSAP